MKVPCSQRPGSCTFGNKELTIPNPQLEIGPFGRRRPEKLSEISCRNRKGICILHSFDWLTTCFESYWDAYEKILEKGWSGWAKREHFNRINQLIRQTKELGFFSKPSVSGQHPLYFQSCTKQDFVKENPDNFTIEHVIPAGVWVDAVCNAWVRENKETSKGVLLAAWLGPVAWISKPAGETLGKKFGSKHSDPLHPFQRYAEAFKVEERPYISVLGGTKEIDLNKPDDFTLEHHYDLVRETPIGTVLLNNLSSDEWSNVLKFLRAGDGANFNKSCF